MPVVDIFDAPLADDPGLLGGWRDPNSDWARRQAGVIRRTSPWPATESSTGLHRHP